MKQLLVKLDIIIPTELNIYDKFDYYINKLDGACLNSLFW